MEMISQHWGDVGTTPGVMNAMNVMNAWHEPTCAAAVEVKVLLLHAADLGRRVV